MFNYVHCYIVSNEKSTVSYSIEFIHAALLYKNKAKLYISSMYFQLNSSQKKRKKNKNINQQSREENKPKSAIGAVS